MRARECIRHVNKPATRLAPQGDDGRFDFCVADYSLQQLVLRLIAYMLIAAMHGFAVAVAAAALGDRGPRHDSRLRIDPLAHLDFVGTIAGIVFSVGWIRPIAIDPKALHGGRAGLVVVVLTGLAATVLGAAALRLVRPLVLPLLSDTMSASVFALIEITGSLSLWFALFNALPLPPTTAAHLIAAAAPAWGEVARRWEFFWSLGLIVLAAFGVFTAVLSPVYRLLSPVILAQ
jgi:Zn-dependent protease